MIDKKMEGAINDQINAELFSAYLYLSMAAHFEDVGLAGMASWMKIQAQEEVFHAMKFFDFINERGGRVKLAAIEEPKFEWSSPLEVFEAGYKHEQYVTGRINDLVDIAEELKDRATFNFLQWYIEEQVEEEATADEIVNKLKLIGDNTSALFMLDKELGARVFTPPVEEGE
ncbi:MAG TPA: ferritin [candidate division Zixibacteria bacterium]|nr:ferritin [candidate division Zixibacteria bacterium]